MISLTDYLYSGDTILKILHNFKADLQRVAEEYGNEVDQLHCEFLQQVTDLLEHNEFLSSQAQRIREFYYMMTERYPDLAFTLKGRIKSLIRAEEKFNGYVVETIYDYYKKYGSFPDVDRIISRMDCFRDLIAYRIVISIPKCHLAPGVDREKAEIHTLYEIANLLPGFLQERGFEAKISEIRQEKKSPLLAEGVKDFYRDYVEEPNRFGYRSLHITLFDTIANCHLEVQLRTKDMDDYAEIGAANHVGYENAQDTDRARDDLVPVGKNIYFDEAYERGMLLQHLQLAELDVNMFGAANNSLINDGCGLFRGRSIQPFEHLSRFQSNLERIES